MNQRSSKAESWLSSGMMSSCSTKFKTTALEEARNMASASRLLPPARLDGAELYL